MLKDERKFITESGYISEAEALKDKHGYVVGFVDVESSHVYDVIRWIRRDRIDGTPCEIAVARRHA